MRKLLPIIFLVLTFQSCSDDNDVVIPDANMYGVQPDIVDGVTFAGTATMVFTSSQNMAERNLFQTWQGAAWNSKTWNIGYYNEYTGSVDIYLLDNQHQRKFGVKLMDAYPKEIQGYDLSAAPATTALKLTVQMQYKYWEEIKIKGHGVGL